VVIDVKGYRAGGGYRVAFYFRATANFGCFLNEQGQAQKSLSRFIKRQDVNALA
jgi:hypothetical protein